jgi:serine phosphatase RsbU (regulator of sigma subunit)
MKSRLKAKNSLKQALVLVVGQGLLEGFSVKSPASQGGIHFQVQNQTHLPTISQLKELKPNLVILNLQNKRPTYIKDLISWASQVIKKYGNEFPILCATNKPEQIEGNKRIFSKVLNPLGSAASLKKEIASLLTENAAKEEITKANKNIAKRNSSTKELTKLKKLASLNSGASQEFSRALNEAGLNTSKLEIAYDSLQSKVATGYFCKITDLSVSHVSILFADSSCNLTESEDASGYIASYIQGIISSEKSRILWSPSELLAKLSNSLAALNRDFKCSAWYGVLNLANGNLTYARAGQPSPLCLSKGLHNADNLENGSGFPLGIIDSMTYREHQARLEPESILCFYTENLLQSLNVDSQEPGKRSLEVSLERAYSSKSSLQNIFQKVKAAIKEQRSKNASSQPILLCKLPSANKSIVTVKPPITESKPNSKTNKQSLSKKNNSGSLLASFEADSVRLTTDQIMAILRPKLKGAASSADLKMSVNKLLKAAAEQVKKGQEISKLLDEIPVGEFELTWWFFENSQSNKIDLSLQLEKGSVPWHYLPKANSQVDELDAGNELALFFENVCVDASGYELSMSKSF